MRTIFSIAILMSLTIPAVAQEPLKIGIIGLDTSHSLAFTKDLNSDKAPPELANCKVVAAYPRGSADIEGSTKRIPAYTDDIKKMGVEVVDSIDELLKRVDCVLLETNDGRPHLEQALQCFKAGKPTFIDKPFTTSLARISWLPLSVTRAVFFCASTRLPLGFAHATVAVPVALSRTFMSRAGRSTISPRTASVVPWSVVVGVPSKRAVAAVANSARPHSAIPVENDVAIRMAPPQVGRSVILSGAR